MHSRTHAHAHAHARRGGRRMDVALPDVAVARKNGQDDVAVGSLIEGALLRAPVLTHLRDFQWQGVRRALELKGRCLFADEMGCGKTPQEGNNVNVGQTLTK